MTGVIVATIAGMTDRPTTDTSVTILLAPGHAIVMTIATAAVTMRVMHATVGIRATGATATALAHLTATLFVFGRELPELTPNAAEREHRKICPRNEVEFGNYKLQQLGNEITVKEVSGQKTIRTYKLVCLEEFMIDGIVGDTVPESLIKVYPTIFAAVMQANNLGCSDFISLARISRHNMIKNCRDAYFPLDILDRTHLNRFYQTVKGPRFEAFSLGQSDNVKVYDFDRMYLNILKRTPSPSPRFNLYVDSTDFDSMYPECTFASALIEIKIRYSKIPPLPVRIAVGNDISTVFLTSVHESIRVWVSKPDLDLLSNYGYVHGRDFRVIEGSWIIPKGDIVYPFRDWMKTVTGLVDQHEIFKSLYQTGAQGGITSAFSNSYSSIHMAQNTFSPMISSHLFAKTRYLLMMASMEAKNQLNCSADGFQAIGGYPITQADGFTIRSTSPKTVLNFNTSRHDEDGSVYRSLILDDPSSPFIEYPINGVYSLGYTVASKRHAALGTTYSRAIKIYPTARGRSVDTPIDHVGQLLGDDIETYSPDISDLSMVASTMRRELKYTPRNEL